MRFGKIGPRPLFTDLPYDAEVEYLESTGTQYLPLTDIHPNYYTTKFIELDYQLTEIRAGLVQQLGASLGVVICTGGGYVQSINTGIVADTNLHRMVFDGVTSPYHVSYDGTSILNFIRSSNTERVFTLFGVDQQGTFIPSCYMRFYRMVIRSAQNGIIEHDYIPFRKGIVGYVYDRVSKKLFGNSGTGMFIVGPDKVTGGATDDKRHRTKLIRTSFSKARSRQQLRATSFSAKRNRKEAAV